jgi:hypothetical protein
MRTFFISAVALTVGTAACSTPVAIGVTAAGGASLVAAADIWVPKDKCDTEGCVYSNALALMLATLGLSLVTAGGIVLAMD